MRTQNQVWSILGIWLLTSFFIAAYQPPANTRLKYNFNPGWKVLVGDLNDAQKTAFEDAYKKVVRQRILAEDHAQLGI